MEDTQKLTADDIARFSDLVPRKYAELLEKNEHPGINRTLSGNQLKVCAVFAVALELFMQKNSSTKQAEISRAINKKTNPQGKFGSNHISLAKNGGTAVPSKYFNAIADIFGIQTSLFTDLTQTDRWIEKYEKHGAEVKASCATGVANADFTITSTPKENGLTHIELCGGLDINATRETSIHFSL